MMILKLFSNLGAKAIMQHADITDRGNWDYIGKNWIEKMLRGHFRPWVNLMHSKQPKKSKVTHWDEFQLYM